MSPHLLLVLVLLAMATTCHSVPTPRPASPAPHTNVTQHYYVVITKLKTFSGAQEHCRTALGGNLASVHSSGRNEELRALARTHGCRGPWIGARTDKALGQWGSHWEDGSAWNFAKWGLGQPWPLIPSCTTIRTRDGSWRSHVCLELRPFICQY